jgi:sulfate permease, SulP family
VNKSSTRWQEWFPILEWTRTYNRKTLSNDAIAAAIVTLMLIPQSLAYALLAGLPAHIGLYASIAPLVIYTVFGSSRVLAVGPVAVVSLMTAAALGKLAPIDSPLYWQYAITLAFLSGTMLLAMGFLRLGFLANFLSHSVVSGFISASAILIAASQLQGLIGIAADGQNLIEILVNIGHQFDRLHPLSLAIGLSTTIFLLWSRAQLKRLLLSLRVAAKIVDITVRVAPVFAIVITTSLAWLLDWEAQGVKLVGSIPQGLIPLTQPTWNWSIWQALAGPALLLSIIGFVESVSVGQTLAAKRKQQVNPNQELVALGASNVGASLTGGFPVTGGFARSAVNFEAGAQTPVAGLMTAFGVLLVAWFFTPLIYFLPKTVLAATIIAAVLSLVDLKYIRATWQFAKPDGFAAGLTLLVTLLLGVEIGLVAGVFASLALVMLHTSKPHIAQVGLVPGTQHFRNIDRHQVITDPQVLSLRIDQSLYFANARVFEAYITQALIEQPLVKEVVLQCSAINDIDFTALESLMVIDERLEQAGVILHLSEVKGFVMDRLAPTPFIKNLRGQVFLSHYAAITTLTADVSKAESSLNQDRA